MILEVPHYASLRGKEREIVILRSDNGTSWREHNADATDDVVQDILHETLEIEGKVDNVTGVTRLLEDKKKVITNRIEDGCKEQFKFGLLF